MKRSLLITVMLCCLIFSCKKEIVPETQPPDVGLHQQVLTANEVKAWFAQQQQSAAYKKALAGESTEFSVARLKFNLDSLRSLKAGDGNVLVAATNGNARKNGLRYGYRRLLFFKDEVGQVHFRLCLMLPDIKALLRKPAGTSDGFTGDVLIFDERNRLIGGNRLVGNRKTAAILPLTKAQFESPKRPTANFTVCSVSSGVEVSVGDSGMYEAHYYQYTNCTTVTVNEDMAYIPDQLGEGGGGGGGGLASYPPPQPELKPVVAFDSTLKIDPKKYMDCFTLIDNNGATFQVKLLIQEASPGTPAPIGGNSVGHVAIALTKTGSNGASITQVVGFYPSDHSVLQSRGQVHDNSYFADYDISASFNVDSAGFRNIIDYISGPPPMYDLFDFNCSSFAYNACLTAGITLPSPSAVYSFPMTQGAMGQPATTVIDIQADAPGALGERLRTQGGSHINTNGGVGPAGNGPCNL